MGWRLPPPHVAIPAMRWPAVPRRLGRRDLFGSWPVLPPPGRLPQRLGLSGGWNLPSVVFRRCNVKTGFRAGLRGGGGDGDGEFRVPRHLRGGTDEPLQLRPVAQV